MSAVVTLRLLIYNQSTTIYYHLLPIHIRSMYGVLFVYETPLKDFKSTFPLVQHSGGRFFVAPRFFGHFSLFELDNLATNHNRIQNLTRDTLS